jgi:hypothetical protein
MLFLLEQTKLEVDILMKKIFNSLKKNCSHISKKTNQRNNKPERLPKSAKGTP